MRTCSMSMITLLALASPLARAEDLPPVTPGDWPMYNLDVRGWRYTAAEKNLSPENAGKLEEKWRFPPRGSKEFVGAIHATPIVVNGHVYFGTMARPAFYKLQPDGKLAWKFRIPLGSREGAFGKTEEKGVNRIVSAPGILSTALVAGRLVFFGDTAGVFYALDRSSGKMVWSINSKLDGFPGKHHANVFMSSPILADGKIIVGGGSHEHPYPLVPLYPCCTGRGFVIAFEPETGKIAWKYDVGPPPKKFKKPVIIEDARGRHVFTHGPATSSIWSAPSYDARLGMIFFGTDVQNSPRAPTPDNPRLDTEYSSAVIAVDVKTGRERWVTQINKGDIYNHSMSGYDPNTGIYKDLSIGDTPKVYDIPLAGHRIRVVGVGCKDGGFYVFAASDGKLLNSTPLYKGKPRFPLDPKPDKRMIALPSPIGGIQSGCATDGKRVFTNAIDWLRIGRALPDGGRVVCIHPDAEKEFWRHERPIIKPRSRGKIGDPVGSGIALGGGIACFTTTVSEQLVVLDAANGKVLKSKHIGTVWSGPSISRGRIYVGTGSILFLKKQMNGILYSFGLPGEDEVGRLGGGDE